MKKLVYAGFHRILFVWPKYPCMLLSYRIELGLDQLLASNEREICKHFFFPIRSWNRWYGGALPVPNYFGVLNFQVSSPHPSTVPRTVPIYEMWMRSSRVWMRSNRVWKRSSRVFTASDSQSRSRNCRNCPGFDPSILRYSESEGRQMKQCWISYIQRKNPKKSPIIYEKLKYYLVDTTTLFGQLFALAEAGHLLSLKLAALSRQEAPAVTQHLLQVKAVEAELHLLLLRFVNRLWSDLRFCFDLRLCLDLWCGRVRLVDSVRLPYGHISQDMLDCLKSSKDMRIWNTLVKIQSYKRTVYEIITCYRY